MINDEPDGHVTWRVINLSSTWPFTGHLHSQETLCDYVAFIVLYKNDIERALEDQFFCVFCLRRFIGGPLVQRFDDNITMNVD